MTTDPLFRRASDLWKGLAAAPDARNRGLARTAATAAPPTPSPSGCSPSGAPASRLPAGSLGRRPGGLP